MSTAIIYLDACGGINTLQNVHLTLSSTAIESCSDVKRKISVHVVIVKTYSTLHSSVMRNNSQNALEVQHFVCYFAPPSNSVP